MTEMTSLCIEGMWAIVYSVSGVSLLPTLFPLVIDIQSYVYGVNDNNTKWNVCAYDWDEFWSE